MTPSDPRFTRTVPELMQLVRSYNIARQTPDISPKSVTAALADLFVGSQLVQLNTDDLLTPEEVGELLAHISCVAELAEDLGSFLPVMLTELEVTCLPPE